MKRLLASVFVVAGVASGASAQCDVFRHFIPDFDQVRSGLPNAGNMYCVPTSAMNLLAYVANRGVPNVMFGARDWQSDANHAFVTGQILTMGVLMGTHPTEGTSGGYVGLRNYLNATARGKFVVCQFYGDFGMPYLSALYRGGGLVNVCYGYYPRDGVGRYTRNGGHCITLSGIMGYCQPTFTLRWRDPASGDNWTTSQSLFASVSSTASSQVYVAGDNSLHSKIRLWGLGDDSTRRYLDSITTIIPTVAISGSVTSSDRLQIRRATSPASWPAESSNGVIPGGNPIRQVVLDPRQTEAFAVTFQESTHISRVWRHNLVTGESTQVFSSEAGVKLATSRFGELFILSGAMIRKYGVNEQGMTLLQQVQTPAAVDAMTYDDVRDELVIVTSTDRLVRFRNDLSLPASNVALPKGVTTSGDASLAIDEEAQQYFICGRNDPRIFVVEIDGPAVVRRAEIMLPAVQRPECVQFTDDGSLMLLSDGVIAEFDRAGDGWEPRQDSEFAGLPGSGTLVVARSRSNFVPGVHDTPEWNNVVVDEGLEATLDCVADFNLDGAVNSQDFFDYLTRFFENDLATDYSFNGEVNSQDFFEFLHVFFVGC